MNSKESNRDNIIALVITVLIVMIIYLFIVNNINGQPNHPDGYLWIRHNGRTVYEHHFNHQQIQCLCDYLEEYGYDCSDYYPGCGATNCKCFIKTETELTKIKDQVFIWSNSHDGYWERGKGVVCT